MSGQSGFLAPLVGAWLLYTLTGCASPVQIPQTVQVPTPVPCLAAADKPARPVLRTEEQLLGLDRYRRTHALWAEWLRLTGYVGELEAVVEGCSRIPAPGGGDARP